MKKRLFIIIPVVIVVALVVILIVTSTSSRSPNVIHVSGNIEVIDVQASFKIPGRVVERPVDEGFIVKAGDLIARLDTQDIVAQVALRKAELDQAEAAVMELYTGTRPEEIEAAKAEMERAQANAAYAKLEFERQSILLEGGVVPQRDLDVARTSFEAATAAARAAEERYNLAVLGPRIETIMQGEARRDGAKAALALAETTLAYATITSPLDGVVLSKNIEPGEYVVPGTPVVTIADLDNVWVRAYVNEPDLGKVKVGQKVRVTTDTYPGKPYDGRVSFIAGEAEFTPKTVQTPQERVRLVYRIKIDIKNKNMELKPGMPVDADIILDEGK